MKGQDDCDDSQSDVAATMFSCVFLKSIDKIFSAGPPAKPYLTKVGYNASNCVSTSGLPDMVVQASTGVCVPTQPISNQGITRQGSEVWSCPTNSNPQVKIFRSLSIMIKYI
jgi:hypothetical protein